MFIYAYFSRRVEQTLGALTLTALANMTHWVLVCHRRGVRTKARGRPASFKDYERMVATLMSGGSEPVITKKPTGAWTHAVYDGMK
jgi:hypothetical protein